MDFKIKALHTTKVTLLLSLYTAWLLVSCAVIEPEMYTLSTVSPSPALPGQHVTIYGNLPVTAEVSLGPEFIVVSPAQGGLQFTLPEWLVAGTYILSVKTSSSLTPMLTGAIQVMPRLDAVGLKGNTLSISGAGWPSSELSGTAVQVSLAAALLVPELSAGLLQVELPEALPYGNLTVQVSVNSMVSELKTLKCEAAAISGSVVMPAFESQQQSMVGEHYVSKQSLTELETKDLKSLIVYSDDFEAIDGDLQSLSGLTSTQLLPLLRSAD